MIDRRALLTGAAASVLAARLPPLSLEAVASPRHLPWMPPPLWTPPESLLDYGERLTAWQKTIPPEVIEEACRKLAAYVRAELGSFANSSG
jgi:hypothetical protein